MLNKHPESYGISSERILAMVKELELFIEDIHSISVVCDDDVIFSKCVPPFDEACTQMMHSFSKSINSMAVGIAIADGKLNLDDLLLDHFREYLPEEYDPRLEKLSVRNMLMMAASSCRLSTNLKQAKGSWITHYLTFKLPHEPGTVFQYDTGASYVLSSLVTKVTGKTVLQLMKERVFAPMGITDVDWLESPEGNTVGGWGLYLNTPDIAKIAILLANRGKWHGQQLVPEDYLREACSKQIDTPADTQCDYGYGYQFWMGPENSFCVNGAFGHAVVVNAEKRIAVAMTVGASDKIGDPNHVISKIVNRRLIIPTTREPLPENPDMEEKLNNYLDKLVLPCPEGKASSAQESRWIGKRITFTDNSRNISGMILERQDDNTLKIVLDAYGKTIPLCAGFQSWKKQEAVFDDEHHHTQALSYAYTEDTALTIRQYCTNLSGYDTWRIFFDGDDVDVIITTSVMLGGAVPARFTGKIQ